MEEKLRSISKITPWWLVARAVAFGMAFWILPYGWFIVAALLFYFIPFFQPGRTALPFLALLGITLFVPTSNFWMALLLSVLMFLILGIKDLLLINRASASEALFFTLSFVMLFLFFGYFRNPGVPGLWLTATALSVAIFFLLNHLMFHYGGEGLAPGRRAVGAGILAFFAFELIWVASILPMSQYLQTGLVLLSLIVGTEMVLENFRGVLSRRSGLLYFSVWFALIILMLTANSWSIWSSARGG